MSNKQQLQLNNEEVASLIELLRGKTAGGSGNGASFETCTVTVSIAEDSRTSSFYCFLTTIENNVISSQLVKESGVFNNVIKNSKLFYFIPEDGRVSISPESNTAPAEIVSTMYSSSGFAIMIRSFELDQDSYTITVG